MQVETLASVAVVVGFFPGMAGFWVWFLSPSLPVIPSRLLLLACTFTSPASWANWLA